MDIMFTHGAGLDVHTKRMTACRVTPDPTGQQADGLLALQDFGTMTADLPALSDWLAAAGVTPVAMESTGEYWKPVFHRLEESLTVFLVNAAHVTQVPGRKTDKADALRVAAGELHSPRRVTGPARSDAVPHAAGPGARPGGQAGARGMGARQHHAGGPPRKEAGDSGGGVRHRGQRFPYALQERTLSGVRSQLR